MMKYGDKVVAEARKHIGTVESPRGSNMGLPAYSGFIDACQRYWQMGRGTRIGPQPWCAMAASKWYRDANVDDQGLFSPSTAIMCSNAVNNGVKRFHVGTVPAGAVIVKCGVHTEIVERDLGNGVLACIGGNTSDSVSRTHRPKYSSTWRIYIPAKIDDYIVVPTRIVYWFEDVRKMPKTYGGWRTAEARDKKLAGFLKNNPQFKGRIRKIKSLKGRTPYKFQVLGPKGTKGGVSSEYTNKALRDKAAKKYEEARGYKVRRRSRKEVITT